MKHTDEIDSSQWNFLNHLTLRRQIRTAFAEGQGNKLSAIQFMDRMIANAGPRTDDGLNFLELAKANVDTARHCESPRDAEECLIEAVEAAYWMNEAETWAENFDVVLDRLFASRV